MNPSSATITPLSMSSQAMCQGRSRGRAQFEHGVVDQNEPLIDGVLLASANLFR
jgi:hypothetical protein